MDLDLEKYGNMLKYLNFDLDSIEDQLRQHPKIHVPNPGDDLRLYQMPHFIRAFYHYILQTEYIPSLPEFIGYYTGLNIQWLNSNILTTQYPNLRNKLAQTFYSIIREFHFIFAMKKYFPALKILYNINLDLEHDIDLLAELDGKYYALALFSDSPHSRFFRSVKENRHTHFDNIQYIEVPFKKEEGFNCGIYLLYDIPKISENLFPMLRI